MARNGLAVVAGALLLASCGSAADPAAVVETVRLTEQSQLQSIESGDVVGIARLYADDAVLVKPDGSILRGGAEIADEYATLLADPNFALTIEPTGGWASEADDVAVLTSEVDFTTTDPESGEPVTLDMHSQTVWTKASGGSWMIRSAYNVAVPPAPAAEPAAE
ncbi:nuclear transport factor 2 family protein [Aurantiacibacter sp. MUD11]|uniref:YybH family protein n=1 Tax=Aurantiacibacter sp. MUD11 TaxID=3003265 RepID=UPI0022AADDF9|nr:nuclear transport factor 2 family protein [Aurantiacibacter sp. MUD11]WAT16862.1 nuclear transport factor 2 family protein [Aurantiacibacter sp. MUD11]